MPILVLSILALSALTTAPAGASVTTAAAEIVERVEQARNTLISAA